MPQVAEANRHIIKIELGRLNGHRFSRVLFGKLVPLVQSQVLLAPPRTEAI
jgi:acid phosphatase family membrane protein YuiD